MRIHSSRTAKAVVAGASVALLALLGPCVSCYAQAPGGGAPGTPAGNKIFTNKTIFHLPIKIDDRLRGELREVYLFVKDGNGPWQRKDAVAPTQTHFTFRVPHDGEYWFSVVTMDRSGRMTPADVTKEPPGLMVVVDTRPTEATAGLAAGANASPARPAAAPVAASVVPTTSPNPTTLPTVPAAPTPVVAASASLPSVPLPPAVSTANYKPSAPAAPVANSLPVIGGNRTNRQLLNTARATVDYRIDQVGPSGVGKVEVWLTADEGHTWQRYGEDADRRSPAEINLPGEGVFGIRLVVTNGNGFGGKAPVAGDVPSSVVEVDMTKPFVQLREIEPVGLNGTVDIRWNASDKNLGSEPINLFYAPSREGPWLPVATNLKNDGMFHWTVPHTGMSQFLIRLECTDLAGNVARCETQTPVVLDTTEPTVQVLNVSGVHGPSLRPSGN
jgi:hypothetical protein